MDNNSFVSIQDQKQLQILNGGVSTADRFVSKNYLIDVSEQMVVPLCDENKAPESVRLFQIVKLVYDKNEYINDKLISVYSALQHINSSALLIIDSNGKEVTLYIGIRSLDNTSTAGKILEKSFIGNFPGSTLRRMKNGEIASVLESISKTEKINTSKNVSCVTVIPSMRDEDKTRFVQGLEKFIDTMRGEIYTSVFIATPIPKEELEMRKRGYEELYSSLTPFMKLSLAYGENFSKAVTSGMFENFSHSINNSVSNTTGMNQTSNYSQTDGENRGRGFSFDGFGFNSGTVNSQTSGYSCGSTWTKSVTDGSADTTGSGSNKSDTVTNGTSRTFTIEFLNKSISILLDKIDKQLKRIDSCETYGVWEYAGYFVADDIQTSVVAANVYKALMLGDGTNVENSFVNVWGIKTPENTRRVLDYIKYGQHPLIKISPEMGFSAQYVTPGNIISGKELPMLMGLPHKSVTGLAVSNIAEFGRNILLQSSSSIQKKICLGQIYHMGKTENCKVELDLNSFTSHCFITGATGSGKSNTTYGMLEKFMQEGIPFLVIEPAKGEYKEVFGAVAGINIFTTNPFIGQMLKLNPFRFDKKIHILEHLDRLIEIFNACWEMYAAMPAILKDALEKVYMEKGWDLMNSVYLRAGTPTYPTFDDLMRVLPCIIDSSRYSSDTKGDYIGALVTRVASLANGISGQIFCDSYDLSDKVLFDQNTIVDLSRVGSSETKSLIMGILVLKLSEYRMANTSQSNCELRHITVMEEAHNLLKRTTHGIEGCSMIGKSVEMICQSIAEMRTYGEGFIIVDQSPTAVDIAAIKNTNTKILLKLPEKTDCETVGNAAGLNEEQTREIAKLGKGIAVVIQGNWLEAVLTHIEPFSNDYSKKIQETDYSSVRKLKGAVIKELMQQYIVDRTMNNAHMMSIIDDVDIVQYKKEEMKRYMYTVIKRLQKGRDIDFFCEILLNISGAKGLFDILENTIKVSSDECENESKYEMESVRKWKMRFREELNQYVELPDNFNNTILKYLIHAKELNQKNIDYVEVRHMLY